MTPAEKTESLIDEVLWWHNAMEGHGVTRTDIMSRSRLAPIVLARADCMRRLRYERGWSYERIGKMFGLDHSTVIHNCNRSVLKPVNNRHGLKLPELRIKRVYDRIRKEKLKRRVGQVVGVQPTGEANHENT